MKHRTQDWEKDVSSWLKRHEVPAETIDKFMPFIWRKVQMETLAAMKAVVHLARHEKPSAYQPPVSSTP